MNATAFLTHLWAFAFGVAVAVEICIWMIERNRGRAGSRVAKTSDTDPRGDE